MVISQNVVIYFYYILTEVSQVDHIGLTSLFNENNGFKGTIHSSKKSEPIIQELLKDCFVIHKKKVDYLKSKGHKKNLIYTDVDMYNSFTFMKQFPVGEVVEINSNLKV